MNSQPPDWMFVAVLGVTFISYFILEFYWPTSKKGWYLIGFALAWFGFMYFVWAK